MTDTSAHRSISPRGFAPATFEKWRQLVDKALKGADFDTRSWSRARRTGCSIEPLYTRADTLPGAQALLPGDDAVHARHARARRDDHGWQIHQRVVEADAGGGEQGDPRGAGRRRQRRRAADRRPGTERHQDRQRRRRGGGAAGRVSRLTRRSSSPAASQGLEAARHLPRRRSAALKPEPGGTAVSRLNVDPIGTLARFGTAWAPIETALPKR